MKKGIIFSLLTINILYASENLTSEKTYGLFFGNLAQAKEDANYYGRWNALLGCLHNRGGSDAMGFADCAELTQIYRDNKANYKIDPLKFRDNVWCMESSNSNLGKNNIPSSSEFEEDIYNNNDIYNFKNNVNLNYNTSVYKYKDGEYQESYKNLSASTTGRLIVLANSNNPFSFYLTNNTNVNLNGDFAKFVNNYVGLLNGKMRHDYVSRQDIERQHWKLTSIYEGWLSNITTDRIKVDGVLIGCGASRYSGCNAVKAYKGTGFLNGKSDGCGVSDWNELHPIERYVRFYYDLENNGCTIRPVDYFDSDGDDVVRDSKGNPLYAAIIDNNKRVLYYRSYANATGGQPRIDQLRISNAKNYNLDRVINGNERCKQVIEEMTLKNISTHGIKDLGNSSNFAFFNNNNLENGTFFNKDIFTFNGIGKCYFTNLQYYDRKNSDDIFTAFPAITAHKFLWGGAHDRFLQNYLASDGKYTIANYSIDRKNIYKGDNPGNQTSIFSLHTRPTSFRGVDESKYGNTPNGRLDAKYNLIFYPDANDSKIDLINEQLQSLKYKVENLPSHLQDLNEFYKVSSLTFDVNNNVQLVFMNDTEKLDPNRLSYANKQECNVETKTGCENMNFKFENFKYKIYKLEKTDGHYKIVGEEPEKTGTYTTNYMAFRVDENLLNTIGYQNKDSILLEVTINNGKYDDNRPFFELNSDSIVKAKKAGKFYVIISDIKFDDSALGWGSIWDKSDATKLPKMNDSNTGYDPSSANTRIAANPVYLGIYNNSKLKLDDFDNFITFEVKDNHGNLVKGKSISFYELGSKIVSISNENKDLLTNPIFKPINNINSYPFYNGVLKIDNLEVGKYEVCYDVYSKRQIQEEINKNTNNKDTKALIDLPKKASGCTNKFSIRPAFIEYSTKTNFIAGEEALNGGKLTQFNVSLKDSSKKDIDTNESFAITKTDLIVENSKFNKYIFDLNNKHRSVISSTNPQAINKQSDSSYIIKDVYVNFPFSTEAKLQMYEGVFTKDDSLGGFCNSGSANNAIGSDGKIGCLIASENPIVLNFSSTNDYKLKDAKLNNAYTNTIVFFKNEIGDQNSLKIPFVFNNKGINDIASLSYVYHKFDDNLELEYDLNFDNEDEAAKNRYLVNIDEVYTDSSYLVNVAKKNIKVSRVILNKDKLNQEFDKKLEELYNETRTTNINKIIEKYEAKPDKISVDLELAYSRYKKTLDNKTLDNSFIKKPDVAEFSLLRSSSVGEVGKTKFNPSKDYSFVYTGITYKDSRIENSNTITLKSSDLELFYLDKKAIKIKFTPETPTYKKSAKDIIDELRFIGDYGSSFVNKKGDLEVTLNPSQSKKQYVKEIVNISNTNDLSGLSFSIEFTNK